MAYGLNWPMGGKLGRCGLFHLLMARGIPDLTAGNQEMLQLSCTFRILAVTKKLHRLVLSLTLELKPYLFTRKSVL